MNPYLHMAALSVLAGNPVPREAYGYEITDPFDAWVVEHLQDIDRSSLYARPSAMASLIELLDAAKEAGVISEAA
jgi:hypothetical protein